MSHKLKSLTTLILTHRFEKAGSAAAKRRDDGGREKPQPAGGWQSQVIYASQKCFRYIEIPSTAHPRCHEQHTDRGTQRCPIILVKYIH